MLDELIEFFGSQADIARALDVDRSAVNQWFANGSLPPARALQIEKLSGGRFKAINLTKI